MTIIAMILPLFWCSKSLVVELILECTIYPPVVGFISGGFEDTFVVIVANGCTLDVSVGIIIRYGTDDFVFLIVVTTCIGRCFLIVVSDCVVGLVVNDGSISFFVTLTFIITVTIFVDVIIPVRIEPFVFCKDCTVDLLPLVLITELTVVVANIPV